MPKVQLSPATQIWLFVYLVVFVVVGGLVWLLLPSVGSRGPSPRNECMNNQHAIALALASYEVAKGCLPPAFIADDRGRPMHSWRVLLLPFLDQRALYDEYDFSEPWNGPHNRKLHDRVVECFACPRDEQAVPGQTSYVAVVGAETAWPAPKSTKPIDITDGKADTLLIVEVCNSGIHWMEPRDLDFATMSFQVNSSPGKGISSHHAGCAVVTYADGRSTVVQDFAEPKRIKAALTVAGDEGLPLPQ
jgi:Protein of unknown function (DUF1559)